MKNAEATLPAARRDRSFVASKAPETPDETSLEGCRSLAAMLETSVAAHGDRPLFGTKTREGWRWTTYAEFGSLVGRMRAALASLGVSEGSTVAIIADNRLEWAVAAYATYGLGAVFVPMYESQRDEDWEYIIRDCGARVLFVSTPEIATRVEGFADKISSLERVVLIEGGWDYPQHYVRLLERFPEPTARPNEVPDGALACLIYTSGTTAAPKGVMLTHRNIISNLEAVRKLFPLGTADRSLSFLPWAHAFGHTAELHALVSRGSSLAICDGVEKIVGRLAETKPTILFAVPKIFNKIYSGVQKQMEAKPGPVRALFASGIAAATKRQRGEKLGVGERLTLALADLLIFRKVRAKFGGRLKYAVCGGAALAKEVAEFIDALGIEVYEGYGLTETSPISTVNWPGSRRLGSAGKPVEHVSVVIDDPHGEGQGEIIVRGPNVMRGYHGLADETAAVFTEDGGFRTGDIGRFDEQGFLFITGRLKEQYKLENGKYVVPAPIEEQLKLSPLIANAMVWGDNRPYNVALVVPDLGALSAWAQKEGLGGLHTDDLVRHEKVEKLYERELDSRTPGLKGYEKIRDFALVLDDFTQANGMLTPTLKLKRRAVIARWKDTLDSLYK